MSKPQSTEEELQALRRAAELGDVNGCWDATQKLLRRLPAHLALRLVREFVTRRLPLFERHQPGVHWPRQFIESVPETGSADDRTTWPEAEDDFPGPGANNFIGSVEALWKAGRLVDDVQRRNELLADAIVGVAIAEQFEHWGAQHPDAWANWYQLAASGSDDPSQYHTLITIKKDPEAAAVQRAAWLELAECLAEALNTSATEPH